MPRGNLSSVTDGPDTTDEIVDDQLIDQVGGWIDRAQRVVVLTGAGISTDSGIPDFRGPNGVWTLNPAERAGDAAELHVRSRGPPEAWQPRSTTRRGRRAQRRPPRYRRARAPGKLDTLVTQNIDGLHQAAGSDPAIVVEVHGTMRDVVCMSCGERAPMQRALDRVRAGEDDPPCRTCGGILKSATISFGQNLFPTTCSARWTPPGDATCCWPSARRCRCTPWPRWCPWPAWPGAQIVIVNDSETAMDHLADAVLRGSIGEMLPQHRQRRRARCARRLNRTGPGDCLAVSDASTPCGIRT